MCDVTRYRVSTRNVSAESDASEYCIKKEYSELNETDDMYPHSEELEFPNIEPIFSNIELEQSYEELKETVLFETLQTTILWLELKIYSHFHIKLKQNLLDGAKNHHDFIIRCEQVYECDKKDCITKMDEQTDAEVIVMLIVAAKKGAEVAKLPARAATETTNDAMIAAQSQYKRCCRRSERMCSYKRADNKYLEKVGGDAAQIAGLRSSQSPIAISLQRCPTWNSLEPLHFSGYWDNPNTATLTNTGLTAYFTFPEGSKPKLSGGPLLGGYVFEQLHFHWSVDDFTGCEHVLDGHGYAAEAHFVHYNSKYGSLEEAVGHPDGLAVVGFLLESVDQPNPRFDRFIEALDNIKKTEQTVELSADSLAWLDQKELFGSYVTYKGSLTTPPFTECVTWIIYEIPVPIGSEQLGVFRQLIGSDQKTIERNVRPTQRHPPGHSVIKVEQHIKSKL